MNVRDLVKRLDLWDVLTGLGVLLAFIGIGLIHFPAALGVAITGFGLLGARHQSRVQAARQAEQR